MEVARRLAAVEAALESEDLTGAEAALDRLSRVAPEHPRLPGLRAQLDDTKARHARREALARVLASARDLLARDDIDAAGRALEEARGLEAEDPETRVLLERLGARRQEREQARRVARDTRVAEGRTRLTAGDLAGAIDRFEAVLAEDGSHGGAAQGLAEARARRSALESRVGQAARRAAQDARVAEGQARLTAGDLAGAIDRFEAVLAEDGSHGGAAQGLADARQRLTAVETRAAAAARRAKLEAWVAEARLRVNEGDLAGAIDRFEEVLAEDGSHEGASRGLAEARDRLDVLEGRVAAAAERAALDARVAEARQRLAEGDLAGAIARFEAVLAEDGSVAEATRGLAEARERQSALETREAAAAARAVLEGHVGEAQVRLGEGDLMGAIARFEAVLADDHGHAAAAEGLADARVQQAARDAQEVETKRRDALELRVAEGRARLASADLTGAIARFEAVLAEDGSQRAAAASLAEARQRLATLDAQVTEGRARLEAGSLDDALARFEAALAGDGAHADARRWLAEGRRRRAAQEARAAEVRKARAALEGALSGQEPEAVEAAFAWLSHLAPTHPELARLRERIDAHREGAEEDREQTVREALAEAGRLIREGESARALAALEPVRRVAPNHPDLPKLQRQAERAGQARATRDRDRAQALLASATELLAKDDLEASERAVREALAIQADLPEATGLLERVQARARARGEAQRADALAAEARQLLDGGRVDEVDGRLTSLEALAPKHPALAELRARVVEARQRRAEAVPREPASPQQEVKDALAEAGRLIVTGRPDRVPEVLLRVRAVAPDHPDLAKLEAQAQKALETRDVRGRVRSLVDNARKLQVRGALEEALAMAEEAVTLAPDEARALRLRDDLAEQLREARQQGRPARPAAEPAAARPAPALRERVKALLASAREMLGRDELPAAKQAVEETLTLSAAEPEARALLEQVQTRERELVEGRLKAALEAGDPAAAQAALTRLVAVAPQHAGLSSLRTRVTELRDRVVQDALAEAVRLIREGRADRAPEVLARVRAVAPEHPDLAKLQEQAQRVADTRDVRGRVRALLDRAQKLATAGDLGPALAAAEEAAVLAPDDARAMRLRDGLAEQLRQTGRKGRPPA